jgi:hypothetical protein
MDTFNNSCDRGREEEVGSFLVSLKRDRPLSSLGSSCKKARPVSYFAPLPKLTTTPVRASRCRARCTDSAAHVLTISTAYACRLLSTHTHTIITLTIRGILTRIRTRHSQHRDVCPTSRPRCMQSCVGQTLLML